MNKIIGLCICKCPLQQKENELYDLPNKKLGKNVNNLEWNRLQINQCDINVNLIVYFNVDSL